LVVHHLVTATLNTPVQVFGHFWVSPMHEVHYFCVDVHNPWSLEVDASEVLEVLDAFQSSL
jgi:hypothetical protein